MPSSNFKQKYIENDILKSGKLIINSVLIKIPRSLSRDLKTNKGYAPVVGTML